MTCQISGIVLRRAVARAALVAGLATLPGLATAAPGDMTVAVFLAKADALQAKGMMAMFSSDLKLLMAEANAASAAWHNQLAAERQAGHPSSCPPTGARVDSNQLLAHMRSYPADKRQQITVNTAWADMFRAKFPCPK